MCTLHPPTHPGSPKTACVTDVTIQEVVEQDPYHTN